MTHGPLILARPTATQDERLTCIQGKGSLVWIKETPVTYSGVCKIIHKINESHINQKDAKAFRSYLRPLSEKKGCRKRIVEIFCCLKFLSMMVQEELSKIRPQ